MCCQNAAHKRRATRYVLRTYANTHTNTHSATRQSTVRAHAEYNRWLLHSYVSERHGQMASPRAEPARRGRHPCSPQYPPPSRNSPGATRGACVHHAYRRSVAGSSRVRTNRPGGRPRPVQSRSHTQCLRRSRSRARWWCRAWRLRIGRCCRPRRRSCLVRTASPHLTLPTQCSCSEGIPRMPLTRRRSSTAPGRG